MDAAIDRPDHARANDRQFVTALARGLDILRVFRPEDGPLGNQELAKRTGLPKPTISRLTYTLTQLGYLNYDRKLGVYSPGGGVLALGYVALAQLDVRRISRPFMQELADECGAAVALGARDRLNMLYIENCEGQNIVALRVTVGSRIPLGVSAMGRAYLAYCTAAERERHLDGALTERFNQSQSARVLFRHREPITATQRINDECSFGTLTRLGVVGKVDMNGSLLRRKHDLIAGWHRQRPLERTARLRIRLVFASHRLQRRNRHRAIQAGAAIRCRKLRHNDLKLDGLARQGHHAAILMSVPGQFGSNLTANPAVEAAAESHARTEITIVAAAASPYTKRRR